MTEDAAKENLSLEGGNKLYYILGAILLVVIIAAGWFLRPKGNVAPTIVATPVVPTPTPGPITGLACERQYYNPVIGFAKYYLSVEGVDLSNASKVDCEITVSRDGKEVATESATSPLTSAPERNGSTFRCTTKAITLTPTVVTKVDIALKDDLGKTATCSANFTLPTP